MLYKPTKKELKQLKALNKGHGMVIKGLNMMTKAMSTENNDNNTDIFYYRIVKDLDNIIKATYELLEKNYIDAEFKNIVDKKTN